MTKRRGDPSCATHNKELYVVGGDNNSTWEKYNFVDKQWTYLGGLHSFSFLRISADQLN